MLSKAEEQLLLLFELELTDDFSQDGLLLAPVAPGSFIQSTADWHFVGSAWFYLLNSHSPFLSGLKSLIEHPLGEMCVRDMTWYSQESSKLLFCWHELRRWPSGKKVSLLPHELGHWTPGTGKQIVN